MKDDMSFDMAGLWKYRLARDPSFQGLSEPQQEAMYQLLSGYQLDITRASVLIPVHEITTDTNSFQIRRHAFSEKSVLKYIGSLLSGRFDRNLLSDTLLRKRLDTNETIMLSGHSRLKTHQLLTDPNYIHPGTDVPLYLHPMVQQVSQEQNIDFNYLLGQFYVGQDKNYAKRLSAISNTLGTPEDQIDRAMFYQAERQFNGVCDSVLGDEFKILEGANRHNVINLSYLHPNGLTLQALASFQESAETYKILYKIAVWIGHAMKKFPEFNNLHENELYEWLYENETFKQKYRRREDFFGEVEDHMKSINFSPDKPLNIKKRKIQHPYMQEYNKILRQLNEEIGKIRNEERTLVSKVVHYSADASREGLLMRLQQIQDPSTALRDDRLLLEVAHQLIDEIKLSSDGMTKEQFERAKILLAIKLVNREQHKAKRVDYLKAADSLPDLFSQPETPPTNGETE